MNELILEKIIKQSQFHGLISNVEQRAIPLKELVEDMNTYYSFTEVLWEDLIRTKSLLTSSELVILQQRAEIQELKKEVDKLTKLINDIG